MARFYPAIFLFFSTAFCACDDENPERQAALDSLRGKPIQRFVEVLPWLGIYQDTLPCADCKGVLTRLELKSDSSYKKSVTFLGKGDLMNNTFSTEGRWNWLVKSKRLLLNSEEKGDVQSFQIEGDTALRMCDSNQKPMSSSRYVLPRL